jgi:hypothetical protein
MADLNPPGVQAGANRTIEDQLRLCATAAQLLAGSVGFDTRKARRNLILLSYGTRSSPAFQI